MPPDMKDIYEGYAQAVYRYLFCLSGDPEISEELAQETFTRRQRQFHPFAGIASPLHGCAKLPNTCGTESSNAVPGGIYRWRNRENTPAAPTWKTVSYTHLPIAAKQGAHRRLKIRKE